MKILVSGSTGLIGTALVPYLQNQGYSVYRLVRRKSNLHSTDVFWDPEKKLVDVELLEGMDVVIHLAGENIMGFWTTDKKERIRKSRVEGTQVLAHAICQLKNPPSVFICGSATGYYGNRGNEVLVEQSAKGEGFLADVCEQWEEASRECSEKGIRTLNIRTGFVISSLGGGFKTMLPVFKWGLGGKLGSGEQYMSWIALNDLIRIIEFVIGQNQLAGPVNAVSPHPVTNEKWTKILGSVVHRPTFFSVPAFAINFLLGELGQEVLLNSARVKPEKLEESGFKYEHPDLEEAFKNEINRK